MRNTLPLQVVPCGAGSRPVDHCDCAQVLPARTCTSPQACPRPDACSRHSMRLRVRAETTLQSSLQRPGSPKTSPKKPKSEHDTHRYKVRGGLGQGGGAACRVVGLDCTSRCKCKQHVLGLCQWRRHGNGEPTMRNFIYYQYFSIPYCTSASLSSPQLLSVVSLLVSPFNVAGFPCGCLRCPRTTTCVPCSNVYCVCQFSPHYYYYII